MSQLRAWLFRLVALVAVGSLALLLLLALGQIVARNLFAAGFPAAEVLSRHLVLFVTLFGAVLATAEQRHIKIDVATAWLPEWCALMRRPLQLLSALTCAALAHAAGRFWWEEWQYAAASDKWIAALAAVLPVGFGVLAFYFLLLGLQRVHDDA